MNNELALKLKEAGFPQFTEEKSPLNSPISYTRLDDGEILFVPTLSEIILAIGDNFKSLNLILDAGLDGKEKLWWAQGKNHGMAGVTMEEAAANLWFALNQKDA